MVVRGRLRLYSASGFFLLLGLVILAIGIGMATLGYWPQSEAVRPAKTRTGVGPDASNGTAADATAANDTAANDSAFNNVQGESLLPFRCLLGPATQTTLTCCAFCSQLRPPSRQGAL